MKRKKKLKQSPIVILIPLGIFSVKRMTLLLQQNRERGFVLQVNQKSIALISYCCLFWPSALVTLFTSQSPKPYSKYQFKSYLIYGKVTETVFVFD